VIHSIDPSFNFYQIIVPDFLHEYELGVWKAVFTHALRLLYSQPGNFLFVIDKRWVCQHTTNHTPSLIVNHRYRSISTFGRLTIRRFPKKVSSMRKLAARDFEDLLQVSNTFLS
jgi:hypothetical protein